MSYLAHFAPSVTSGGKGAAIAVLLIVAAAAWNLLGAKSVGDTSVAMGVVLLAPFAVVAVWGFFHHAAPAARAIPLRNVDFLGGILVAL